jgi:hypothetical protein
VTVRWRLTLVATIVFGVAFSAAAFGLVAAVRNSLEDGIEKTNQTQLNELAQQLQESANPAGLDLPGASARQDPKTGKWVFHIYGQPPRGAVFETEKRVGDVTLVAERSLTEVNGTVDDLKRTMFITVPLLILLVGAEIGRAHV